MRTLGFIGLAITVAASLAHGAVVGTFDSSRINYTGGVLETGDYATIRGELSSRGDTISSLTTLDSSSLSRVNVFYTSLLNTSTGVLADSEKTALESWVKGGGTLFAAGDGSSWFTAYNSFLNPFSITIGPTDASTGTATISDTSSKIISGSNGTVGNFDFFLAGFYGSGTFTTLATYNDNPVLIQKTYGKGQIVAIGDHNLFTDSHIGTNGKALFLNILDSAKFTAIPEPGSAALMGLGLLQAALLWRRRKRRAEETRIRSG